MPRKKVHADTYAERKSDSRRASLGPKPAAPAAQVGVVDVAAAQAALAVLAEIDTILEPSYGRYSVNRDSNGTAYHKFRWAGGRLAGRYVMFVADHAVCIVEGLAGLIEKVHAAEEGRVQATLDRYK